MLQDNFGRRFHYLRLSVTDVCNFSCDYCLPDGYQCDTPRNFLNLTEIETLVHAFAQLGTRKVRVTGGEPTLRKDLDDILRVVAQTPGIEEVALTTNGYKLPQYVERWKALGLSKLNVSIDSLDPRQFESITGFDHLTTILAGIDQAIDYGLTVKINTVLMRDLSAQQWQQFVAWAKDTPITLRFIELMQTTENSRFFEAQHVSAAHWQQHLEASGWQLLQQSKTAGPAKEYSHPDYHGRIGFIAPYSKDFCSSCNRLRVSALGKLHLCLFAERGLDLRSHLTAGDVAATKATIVDLLHGKQATHNLLQNDPGATRHLAMLGG